MTSTIKWQCLSFNELSGAQMHAILKARCDVFVVEQNCAFPEIDLKDHSALHLIAWGDNDQLAAYLRIHPPHTHFAEPSLGRILSTSSYRGTGLGGQLVEQGLKHLEAHYPDLPVRIGAQCYLLDFYRSFGFNIASEEYLEDGIPHIEMLKPAVSETN
ncbi:ElaA protein [Oxalobacteraceae bacterium GrIS 2.11]